MKNTRLIDQIAGAIVISACCILGILIFLTSTDWFKSKQTPYKGEYDTELFQNESTMKINIIMPDSKWKELQGNAINKQYVDCDIEINGQVYSNVGIRAKGNSSLSAVYNDTSTQRYSYKIEFDHYVKGQSCMGLDKLILNNSYCDATNMKEYLTYDMFDFLGEQASLCNYAELSLNGKSLGIYVAIEGVENTFCIRNYGFKKGYLYKPEIFAADKVKQIDQQVMGKVFGSMSVEAQEGLQECLMEDVKQDEFDFSKMKMADIFGKLTPKAQETMMIKIVERIVEDLGENAFENEDVKLIQQFKELSSDDKKRMSEDIADTLMNAKFDFSAVDISQLFERLTSTSKGDLMGSTLGFLATGDLSMEDLNIEQLMAAMSEESKRAMLNVIIKDISNGNIGMDTLTGNEARGSDLTYVGDELDEYAAIWEGALIENSQTARRKIVNALKAVKNREDIEKYINVDNVLKYMAVNTFVVNLDSLSGSMSHNYYLYLCENKLNLIPWDYNLAFGGYMAEDASTIINFPIDTPFIRGIDIEKRDFFMGLLENPTYRETYYKYLTRLSDEYVEGGRLDKVYKSIRSNIDNLVESDPTAFYTYDEYDEACKLLYKTIQLRAKSVRLQIAGEIPSTNDGQKANSEHLVDASEIDLKKMGVMEFFDVVDVSRLEQVFGISIK